MLNWLPKVKPAAPTKSKTRAGLTCAQCRGTQLTRKLATYPVPLDGKLIGRRIDVYRVELDQCKHCGHLMPTKEGKAKVKRCVKTGSDFFLKNLP